MLWTITSISSTSPWGTGALVVLGGRNPRPSLRRPADDGPNGTG